MDAERVRALERFEKLLCEWNTKLNLTAIERPDEVRLKHFVDSLSCVLAVDFSSRSSLIDVGTGAGFPGLVLKIVYPHLRVTLLDAVRKKLLFLARVVDSLGLTEVRLIHARAEDGALVRDRPESPGGRVEEIGGGAEAGAAAPPGPRDLRERFDVVTSRAVARMNVLAEWTLPYARVGGEVLAMKGPEIEAEVDEAMRAVRLLGGGAPTVRSLVLPGSEVRRSLVLIPKVRPTPARYPRPAGSARRAPL